MKAALFNKDGSVSHVITNVYKYDDDNIYGDEDMEGLSPHVTFKIFADDAEISIDSEDIKPNEDLKKSKLAQIAELKQKTNALDYVILQRYREEKLGKPPSKPDVIFLAKLQEQEAYIQEIRQIESELSAL